MLIRIAVSTGFFGGLTNIYAVGHMAAMATQRTLAEKRSDLDLSQAQLASILGIDQSTVSRNETAVDPDRRYVLALDALAVRKGLGERLA